MSRLRIPAYDKPFSKNNRKKLPRRRICPSRKEWGEAKTRSAFALQRNWSVDFNYHHKTREGRGTNETLQNVYPQ